MFSFFLSFILSFFPSIPFYLSLIIPLFIFLKDKKTSKTKDSIPGLSPEKQSQLTSGEPHVADIPQFKLSGIDRWSPFSRIRSYLKSHQHHRSVPLSLSSVVNRWTDAYVFLPSTIQNTQRAQTDWISFCSMLFSLFGFHCLWHTDNRSLFLWEIQKANYRTAPSGTDAFTWTLNNKGFYIWAFTFTCIICSQKTQKHNAFSLSIYFLLSPLFLFFGGFFVAINGLETGAHEGKWSCSRNQSKPWMRH